MLQLTASDRLLVQETTAFELCTSNTLTRGAGRIPRQDPDVSCRCLDSLRRVRPPSQQRQSSAFDDCHWMVSAAIYARLVGELTDILVGELVGQAYALRLMFHGFAIDYCMLELLHNSLVDRVALAQVRWTKLRWRDAAHKILNRTCSFPQNHGG